MEYNRPVHLTQGAMNMGKTSEPNARKRQDLQRKFPLIGAELTKEQKRELNAQHGVYELEGVISAEKAEPPCNSAT